MAKLRSACLLFAAPAALVSVATALPAHAVLTYSIYESGGNVIVQTSGNLILPASIASYACDTPPPGGGLASSSATVCAGPPVASKVYKISGPANFNGTVNTLPADATSGVPAWLIGKLSVFGLDSGYTSGSAIVSSATYNGKTLASLGFTTTGQIGEWTLQPADPGDPYTAFDKINVVLVPPTPPPSAVPGPLPLLGVSAAFGLSRRLRRRVARHPSHQPKA